MNDIKSLALFLATLTPAQWTAVGSSLWGLWVVFCSTSAFLLGILGNRYPWAMRAAVWFGDRGDRSARVAGNAAGGALPGGTPPALALAKSFAPRPSLLEMCPVCGTPAVLPKPENKP